MRIPKSWQEITIAQYRSLISIPEEVTSDSRIIRTIAILTGISPRAVLKLTSREIKEINDSVGFINNLPSSTLKTQLEVNGIRFGLLPDLNALSIGEIIDLEEYLANWNDSIHKMMTILYRPIKQEDAFGYTVEEYDTQRSLRASEWFDQQCSIEDVYAASIFFSIGGSHSLKFMKTFLEQQKMNLMIQD